MVRKQDGYYFVQLSEVYMREHVFKYNSPSLAKILVFKWYGAFENPRKWRPFDQP